MVWQVAGAQQQQPNFLFILADDLGYMDVGFNNPNTFYHTPQLNRLAASGLVFTDFYAASPTCSPTRASILSGKHPARMSTTNFFTGRRSGKYAPADFKTNLPLNETTLAEALKQQGYHTFFTGKWHLGGKDHGPQAQGFDINKGGGANGHPRSHFSPYKNLNLSDGPEGEYLTDRLTNEAIQYLKKRAQSKEQPFLLYLSYYAVHTPIEAPTHLIGKYQNKAKKLGFTNRSSSIESGRERQVWPYTKEKRKVRIRQDDIKYAAMVESMDTAIGQLLSTLDQLGLKDNTVVVFTSDNGGLSTAQGLPTSNLPLRGGKGWIYEGGIRVPAVIRWPGVTPPGKRCSIPASTTDIYPTFLEIAKIEAKPDQHQDGISLVPTLKNPFAKFSRGPLYFHFPHYSNQGGVPASAMRDGEYKLVQDLEDGEYELYNLKEDISEHNNLAQLEEQRVKEMAASLDSWRRQMKARSLRTHPKTNASPPKLW